MRCCGNYLPDARSEAGDVMVVKLHVETCRRCFADVDDSGGGGRGET